MSSGCNNKKLAHLIWCAMVALLLARQEGRILSTQQENFFLIRWLSDAKRQRRFSREVSADIHWLLNQGRTQGLHARLFEKLEYLWCSANGNILEQADLFRLTKGLAAAKQHQWKYYVLTDRSWEGRHRVTLSTDHNAVYILKSAIESAFTDEGRQTAPLPVKLTGNISELQTLLATCGWYITDVHNDTAQLIGQDPTSGANG